MRVSFSMLLVVCLAVVSVHCSVPLDSGALSVVDNKTSQKLRMSHVDAEVKIYGSLAETRLLVTFSNSTKRDLEASVDLPLPEGASITGYELEVNGTLREGVIVDKELGREAFENIVRGQIDPGLLEKGTGNAFKTRIYPVPAKGSKTFVLSYVEPIRYDSSGRGNYRLPVSLRKKIDEFDFKLNAQGVHVYEKNKLLGDSFVQSKSVHRKGFRSSSLELILQKSADARTGIVSKGRDGKRYFYIDAGVMRDERSLKKPKLIQLVWDASHSASQRSLADDLALLTEYGKYFGDFDVDLKVVRNTVSNFGRFTVRGGRCDQLLETLKEVPTDGSSELGKVSYSSKGYDLSLVFSDGVTELTKPTTKHPVYVINSSIIENSAYLDYLVRVSGGKKISSKNKDALRELVTESSKLKSVSGAVEDVRIFHSNGSSYAVGRLTGDSKVKLHYGKEKVEASETAYLVSVPESSAPALLWAQSEVAALSLNKIHNREKIVSLAQKHHLVTDFTSLIVLDRIEDYARYRIIPKDRTLRQQYDVAIKNVAAYDQEKLADLDKVYSNWKELKAWHQDRQKKMLTVPSIPTFVASPGSIKSFASVSVEQIITAGIRSGDFGVSVDSVDSFLNNPNKGEKVTSIQLKAWDPNTDYIRRLKTASSLKAKKQIYYAEKVKYNEVVGFYLDCAQFFYKQGYKSFAYQIVSNLAEIGEGRAEVIRLLGQQYLEWGELDLALRYYTRVKHLRGEEPQSYRDLAMVYIAKGSYQKAADLLWTVVNRDWDWRFNGIELIALNEWNNLYHKKKKYISLKKAQSRFVYNVSAGVRVVLSWDTDNSDMDLMVTEPNGEKCYFGNKNTKSGGRISEDMTGGRGPEEFMIKSAHRGEYKVEANYFGSNEQTLIGPTTVTVYFIKNWGKKNEQIKQQKLRLYKTEHKVLVGTFIVE